MLDNARSRAVATAWAGASIAAGAMALFLAANHPLWPLALPLAVAAWMLLAYRCPHAWLFALPACLPALNLSPWTGWIGVEEFDLLVLAAVAAGYARLARVDSCPPPLPHRGRAAVLAVAALTATGLWRGVADAGGWHLNWFQGYAEPLNSLRVAKSAIHVLLLLPLLRQAWFGDREAAFRRFALGMLAGAVVTTLAVLWERAAFPGLLDVVSPYRSVGLFWEMHVGGAAIDAYVVLCTPFVAWSLWAARGRAVWTVAALFALLWTYACLSTFSRGAYLGIATGLLVLGLLLPTARAGHWWSAARALAYVIGAALLMALTLDEWGIAAVALAAFALSLAFWLRWRTGAARRQRSLAMGLLLLALVFEVVVMVGPESFMSSRLANSSGDYQSRRVHWMRGLDLLQSPLDWSIGIGLGRLPAHYDHFAPQGEFPGHVGWHGDGPGSGYFRLAGPRSRAELGGRYGLTQRVPPRAAYRLEFDVRVDAQADLLLRVCESHLLYDRHCQGALVHVRPRAAEPGWRRVKLPLEGRPMSVGRWFAPRQTVLTMAVVNVAGRADIDNLVLASANESQLLVNGNFASAARWLPAGQGYFVPWHIDNLWLELLIERGLAGLGCFLLLVGAAAAHLWRRFEAIDPPHAFVTAALCGVLSLGLLSSVFDAPRVALVTVLLLAMGNLRLK
jgi:hypothetical protein